MYMGYYLQEISISPYTSEPVIILKVTLNLSIIRVGASIYIYMWACLNSTSKADIYLFNSTWNPYYLIILSTVLLSYDNAYMDSAASISFTFSNSRECGLHATNEPVLL